MQLACQRCRRLVAAGCLAERAGQPTQIMLHMGLDQLRDLPGADDAEAAWAGAAAGPGADCDATIVPVVTGHVDPDVLDRLAAALRRGREAKKAQGSQDGPGGKDGQAAAARCEPAERAARQIVIAHAADLLSGPCGLAACLRTGLLHSPAASVSLPLDAGAATETIPRAPAPAGDRTGPALPVPRLRTAPGSVPAAPHRAPVLIAVHRWGWGIVLLPDGTVTATSPDRTRTLRSHSPPAHAA